MLLLPFIPISGFTRISALGPAELVVLARASDTVSSSIQIGPDASSVLWVFFRPEWVVVQTFVPLLMGRRAVAAV